MQEGKQSGSSDDGGWGGLTADMSKMQTDFNTTVTPDLKHTHSQTQGLPQILYRCAPSSGKKSSSANFKTISVDMQLLVLLSHTDIL